MPPISVLIKPASSKCNLKCRYCFYHDVADNRAVADFGLMSPATLETIIRKVLRFASGQASFSFQGGEPSLCGLDFFRSVIKLQQELNVNHVAINNAIQTNGVLIDAEWAEFLHANNFLVGLSLDGHSDIHDKFRVDANNHGTFSRVMETSALLDKYDVEYNILFVVTSLSSLSPELLYDYFKDHLWKFLQFMPCIDPSSVQRGSQNYSLDPSQFTHFLMGFFDKWYADILGGHDISVRYFDNLVRMVMGMKPEMCSLLGSCQCQFVFEADGSVYPCDFYVTDAWELGNIHDKEILELYNSSASKRFRESSLSLPTACRDCKWLSLCRGGCRRDRENLSLAGSGLNYYCQTYRDFLEYVYPKLLEIAQYVRKRYSLLK